MASTADFRNGLTFLHDGEIFRIVEFQHVKPGKGGAFVRTKIKNVRTGRVLEPTFRSGEKIEIVRLESRKLQYLYQDANGYVFMDNESFDQLHLPGHLVEEVIDLMKENTEVDVLFHGEEALGIELPQSVDLRIVETEPNDKGDTASGSKKPARLETGATVNVPFFVGEGEVIRVDTRKREYVERVKG
ncbi:MAG: elongation factor P [bacterium]|jgi:elongation factor P|nr:elongation factor P [bacterium]